MFGCVECVKSKLLSGWLNCWASIMVSWGIRQTNYKLQDEMELSLGD